jgi:hypothetical protein
MVIQPQIAGAPEPRSLVAKRQFGRIIGAPCVIATPRLSAQVKRYCPAQDGLFRLRWRHSTQIVRFDNPVSRNNIVHGRELIRTEWKT